MFSSYSDMKLEINNRKKFINTCKVNNTFLNNPWVKEEVTREIRKYFEVI